MGRGIAGGIEWPENPREERVFGVKDRVVVCWLHPYLFLWQIPANFVTLRILETRVGTYAAF